MLIRPRRNRATPARRALVRETVLTPADLVLPLFVHDHPAEAIPSMPGCFRQPIDGVVATAR